MKSFPVTTFLTHLRPHLDEIMARFMLVRWGEAIFPGVSKSDIRYLTTGILPDDVPPHILEEKGILPVGVGGGFLDEHSVDGMNRKIDECASTLVSTALSLTNDVPLQRILTEVRHCDLTNLVKPTQLSSLVKLRHRHHQYDASKVLEWTFVALHGLYGYGAKQLDKGVYPGIVEGIFEDLIREHGWGHEQALTHVRLQLSQSEGNSHLLLTELAHIFKVLNKKTKKKAALWLREVLIDMYHDSRSFFKAVDEIASEAKGKVAEFASEHDTFPVLATHSDNEHVSRAARSKYCGYVALVIQRNTKGNTGIFLNVHNQHVIKERLHLDNLVRMIRLREQTRLGFPQGQWDSLAAEGTLRRIRMWYYSKDRDMILNGAVTTPDVKPSKLTLEEILDISQQAFKRNLVWKWREKYARASEAQHRRGTFRTASPKDPTKFRPGQDINHVSFSLPTQQEVERELERIMIA